MSASTSLDFPHQEEQAQPAIASPESPAPQLSSHAVLQGHKSVFIEHNGANYRLQTTRQGKLILTK